MYSMLRMVLLVCAATVSGYGCRSGAEETATKMYPERAADVAVPVRVAAHKSDLKTAMEPVAILEGRIIDEWGNPVPGANVVLFRSLDTATRLVIERELWESVCTLWIFNYLVSLGKPVASGVSGPDGCYRLEGVEDGTYAVRVTREGFAYREETVQVGP